MSPSKAKIGPKVSLPGGGECPPPPCAECEAAGEGAGVDLHGRRLLANSWVSTNVLHNAEIFDKKKTKQHALDFTLY